MLAQMKELLKLRYTCTQPSSKTIYLRKCVCKRSEIPRDVLPTLVAIPVAPWNVRTEKHERGNGTRSLQGLYNLDHVQRNRFLQVVAK